MKYRFFTEELLFIETCWAPRETAVAVMCVLVAAQITCIMLWWFSQVLFRQWRRELMALQLNTTHEHMLWTDTTRYRKTPQMQNTTTSSAALYLIGCSLDGQMLAAPSVTVVQGRWYWAKKADYTYWLISLYLSQIKVSKDFHVSLATVSKRGQFLNMLSQIFKLESSTMYSVWNKCWAWELI